MRNFFFRLKSAVSEFLEDDALTLAAALAFYTALSLSPLLLILLWLASFLGPDTREALVREFITLVGPQAGEVIRTIVENAENEPSLATLAGVLSLMTLLVSASGVFGQLQHSLNLIWNVKAENVGGVLPWIRKRLLSAGMVFTLGFLMIVSLAMSAALAYAVDTFNGVLPLGAVFWQIIHAVVSMLLFAGLFTVLFRVLPDTRISWHEVWFGGFVTSVLFTLGKFGIAAYLGHSSVASTFGAAGSLILLLLWVYYSAVIFFFGAEIAQVWRKAPAGAAYDTALEAASRT